MTPLRSVAIRGASGLLAHLPERPMVALAEATGELWYRATPDRAARARRNLRRVATWCATTGRGTALARRAATDPRALERLVRLAYQHAARYYLEVARTSTLDVATVVARLDLETPEAVDAALAGGRPVIVTGAHFGAIEVPVIYLAARTGYPFTAPMETVPDPGLQAWIERSRSRAGIRVVPLERARRELAAVLRAGRSVGLVADRDLTGGGVPVPFFGVPAPMPVGPALLAIETGAPLFVGGARRAPHGRYVGRLTLVEVPQTGTHRERVLRLLDETVTAFEALIAEAPEQWWAAFQPIWPDLEGTALPRRRAEPPIAGRRAADDDTPTAAAVA
jgi:phosphatidylinositol dimannoside acyltransferase